MSPWSEDFSASSLDDVRRSQDENRAWNKQLRLKVHALVNDRLAKNISHEDYMATRKLMQVDSTECRRRAAILDTQIVRVAGLRSIRGSLQAK